MARRIQIADGLVDVIIPGNIRAQGGQVFVISDGDFTQMTSAVTAGVIVDLGADGDLEVPASTPSNNDLLAWDGSTAKPKGLTRSALAGDVAFTGVYEALSRKNVASGYAGLDGSGLIATSQIPALALVNPTVVVSQAAMLALTAQGGDVAVRSDISQTFMLKQGGNPTVLSDWVQLATPTGAVISVNSQTGAVTLIASDVGAPPTSRQVIAGTGLTGGGDMTADRTFAVAYGTTSGTAAQGNDGRLSDTRTPTDATVTDAKIVSGGLTNAAISATAAIAKTKLAALAIVDADISSTLSASKITGTAVVQARQVIAGTGLTGGGDLSADRTLTVAYGTTSGTAAQGNDGRLSDTRTPTDGTVTDAKITSGGLTNAAISATAAIAKTKLAALAIVDADISSTLSASKITGTAVVQARQVISGTGLTGGGDLSADRTLAVSYASATAALTVGGTAGSASTAARSDHAHTRGYWIPSDHGLLAWSVDPGNLAANGTLLANGGEVNFTKVHLSAISTVANIVMFIQNAGGTLTSGQCFAALYDNSKNLLGTTASQHTAWQSAGLKTMALTAQSGGSLTNLAVGDYYVAFYAVGSSMPGPLRAAASGAFCNAGLTGESVRFGTADTGRTTSMPLTMAASVSGTISYWVALS